MPHQDPIPAETRPPFVWALAISLLVHGMALFMPGWRPEIVKPPSGRITATLAPRPIPPVEAQPPAAAAAEAAPAEPQPNKKKLLALDHSDTSPTVASPPPWSAAERDDMSKFLRELDQESMARPSLAQRSLAMAGAIGRQREQQAGAAGATVERLPGSPEIDPFSMEMYLDGLVKKLNRSAAFVKNDRRNRGKLTATVLVRLNPDGSLQTYKVINAGDQQDEIAFIQSVVERALPFAAFPADIRNSAASLAMVICISPVNSGGAGFGFTRTESGRRC